MLLFSGSQEKWLLDTVVQISALKHIYTVCLNCKNTLVLFNLRKVTGPQLTEPEENLVFFNLWALLSGL